MPTTSCAPPERAWRPSTRPHERLLRGAAFAAHALFVWMLARIVCPVLGAHERRALAARLARQTLALLGVRVVARGGTPYRGGPCLLIANHVSWLDVYALQSLGPARYVAKAEVRRWPVAGGIARGFDTLFIVRGSLRDARRVKDAVAAALRAGQRVVVFPEGTTTDGAAVGRFHAAMLQAAVDATAPVQAVAIRYRRPDGERDAAAAFVGDTSFVASLRAVLRRPRMTAELTIGPVVRPHGLGRRDLVEVTHRFVRLALADAWDPAPARAATRRAA